MKDYAFSLRIPDRTHPYRVSGRMHQALINVNSDPTGRYNPITMNALKRLGLVTHQERDARDVQGCTRRGAITERGRAVLGGVREFHQTPVPKRHLTEPDWTGHRCVWCDRPVHPDTPDVTPDVTDGDEHRRLCDPCHRYINRTRSPERAETLIRNTLEGCTPTHNVRT